MSGTTDPEIQAAVGNAFDTAYDQSGLPASFYNTAKGMMGQESSYGAADPQNPLQVTSSTASDPGYGVSPISDADRQNPLKSQTFALKLLAAKAKALGIDPSDPANTDKMLALQNGGGDPQYAQHVRARMGQGVQVAQNGTSDFPSTASGVPPSPPSQGFQQIQAPQLNVSMPAPPPAVEQALNDDTGGNQTNGTRDLYALAAGFAGKQNFGQGISAAAAGLGKNQTENREMALRAWETQQQQAMAMLNEQRYQAMMGISAGKANNQSAYQGGKLDLGQGNLDEKTRLDNLRTQLQSRGMDLNAAGKVIQLNNANRNNTKQGLDSMTTPTALQGVGASGLPNAPQQAPQGAPPPPPPAPQGAPPPGPQQSAQPSPDMAAVFPTGAPGQAPQGAPPQAPPQAPQAPAQAAPPKVWPTYGSNLDTLMPHSDNWNKAVALNQKQIPKELDGDTSLLEGYNTYQTIAQDQKALMQKFAQEHPEALTGSGFGGKFTAWMATQANDPTYQEMQKNSALFTQQNYPHGVGQLRNAELHTAKDMSPGPNMSFDASNHLMDSKLASNSFMKSILTGRQQWIAQHPNENPAIGYDPMANEFMGKAQPFQDVNGQVVPYSGPSLFDYATSKSKGGRYQIDPETQQATQAAFSAPPAAPSAPAQTASAMPPQAPSAAAPNVPTGAVSMLRSNPSLSAAFDQKYGPGAAERILQAR